MVNQLSIPSNGLGQRIKELRQKRGLTQKELASILGCAQTTVAGWEGQEERLPSKHFLVKLTEVLNVTLDYLLNLEIPVSPKIPCYRNIKSREFVWPGCQMTDSLEVSREEYSETKFALNIVDTYMEPIIFKGDYCIFDKSKPENRDIVIVRFPLENNRSIIRIWKQNDKDIALLPPSNIGEDDKLYLFHISSTHPKNYTYIVQQNPALRFTVEGVLVGLKRIIKNKK